MKSSKTTGLPKLAAGSKTTPARKRADWEAVERDYRTGRFTLRELAAKHGGTHQAVAKQAKKLGWTQDLSMAVRAATNARVIEQTVANEVAKSGQAVANVVMAAAEVNKQVILGQRSRVGQAVGVSMRMLAELDATTTAAGQINAMFERITEDMDAQSLAAAQAQFKDFMRLHSRIGSAQKLMDALGKAQAMEEKAFGLAAADPERAKKDAPASVYEMSDDELLADIREQRAARRAEAE